MNYLAKRLAGFLADNSSRSVHTDELRYGIEIVLGALLQIILVAIAAVLAGILKETITVMLTAFLYRRYTGGVHCEKYYRCTVSTIFTLLIIGKAAAMFTIDYMWVSMTLVLLLSLYLIFTVVPVDNPVLTIDDPMQRRKMKTGAMTVLLTMLTVSSLLIIKFQLNSFGTAILLGLFWQDITLFRPGIIYIHAWDKLFGTLEHLLERR
ncbi:MAG: accessory regulator [Firmicutes bacterium]|nr:accessory regulator [Bacillota bacterium]